MFQEEEQKSRRTPPPRAAGNGHLGVVEVLLVRGDIKETNHQPPSIQFGFFYRIFVVISCLIFGYLSS